MRRSFGRIRNRGGVFYIRYRLGGKEYEERAGTEKQADKLLSRREAELGLGVFTAPDTKRTTFDDLVRMVRDDYRVNARKSTERLDCSIKHLEAAFGGQRALTITADRLTTYLGDRLEAGAAPMTAKNELNALRRGFTLAKRAGKVAAIPTFPQLDADRVRTGFFEDGDVAAVRAELSEDLQPVLDFGWLTGWRKGEITTLRWSQVDFKAGVVRLEVGSTKNNQGREFPFGAFPPLRALLERQRDRTRAAERRLGQIIPHVFHRDGKPVRDFFTAWASACVRAARDAKGAIVRPQVVGRLFHDLRRSAVRRLEKAGVPRSVAMKLTGHKTESVYTRYAIVASQDLRDGVAKLAALGGQDALTSATTKGTQGGQTAHA
jgi:integrase